MGKAFSGMETESEASTRTRSPPAVVGKESRNIGETGRTLTSERQRRVWETAEQKEAHLLKQRERSQERRQAETAEES